MTRFSVEDRRDLPVFIHSELDDFGLDPFEFRVYARLSRRAGSGGKAYESVPNVAKATKMSDRKVRYALRVLCALGLVGMVEGGQGETNTYRLQDKVLWASRSEVSAIRAKTLEPDPEKKPRHRPPAQDAAPAPPATPAPSAAPPLHDVQPPPAPGAAKGSPSKVLPLEGSPRESALAKTGKAQELVDLYNEMKPPAWSSCHALNEKRKRAIDALFAEHGLETLTIFRAALVYVGTSEWWREKDMALDTLLTKGRVLEFAEKADNLKALAGLSEANRKVVNQAQEIYSAIGGDDAG